MTAEKHASTFLTVVVDGMLKFRRRGDFFQTRDEFKSLRMDHVDIEAARNEHEPFQVVVLAAEGDLKDVTITVGEFRTDDGSVLDPRAVVPHLAHYIPDPVSRSWYPDALLPFTPFDLTAGESQAVWFDVTVGVDTDPGTYRGTVTVHPHGLFEQTATVSLTVFPFILPSSASTRTAFGIGTQQLSQWHGVPTGTPEFEALYDKYYWFLVDRLISPQHLPVPLEPNRMAPYLNDPRVSGVLMPYSDDATVLGNTIQMYKEHGWMDKAYLYPVDEPYGKAQYDRLTEAAGKIHAIEPSAKVICPYYRNPEFAEDDLAIEHLTGSVDIWCALTSYYHQDVLRERIASGDNVWWYTCCVPIEPYPNFQIQMPPIDHRILFWQMRHFDIEGFLYWSVNTWTDDPYKELPAMWLESRQRDSISDGHLLYPGPDGPVSSIRLELIREGLEDLQYLQLLEDMAGPAEAKSFVQRLVGGTTFYERDPRELMKVRSQLARRICEG